MKKIMLFLGATAVLLFWAEAVGAAHAIFRRVHAPLALRDFAVGKIALRETSAATLQDMGPPPVEIVENVEDPLTEIPGIRAIAPGDPIVIAPFEIVYLLPGFHYLHNDIGEGAQIFSALGAYIIVPPGVWVKIGKPNGDLVLFSGYGNRHLENQLFAIAGHMNMYESLFTGFSSAITIVTDKEDASLSMHNCYGIGNASFIVAVDKAEPFEISYWLSSGLLNTNEYLFNFQGETNIELIDSFTDKNSADLFLHTVDNNIRFFAERTFFGQSTSNRENFFGLAASTISFGKNGPYEMIIMDCQFFKNPWEYDLKPVPRDFPESMMVYEHRPRWIEPALIWSLSSGKVADHDFDVSGDVDINDILLLAQDFGSKVGATEYARLYDRNQSGIVDLPDLTETAYAYIGLPRTASLDEIVANPKTAPLVRALANYPAIIVSAMSDPEFGPVVEYVLNATAVLDQSAEVPSEFALSQNYPNPFNANTNIRFALDKEGEVSLIIRDALGRVVRTLVQEHLTSGVYTEMWDGKDNFGVNSGSGVYLLDLSAGSNRAVRKIMLLR